MDKEKFKELCYLYFLDDLSSEDYSEFSKALQSRDPELQNIYINAKQIIMHLPLAIDMVEPPVRSKQNILKAIKGNDIKTPINLNEKIAAFLGLNKLGFAFALTLILLTGIIALVFYVSSLVQDVKSKENRIAELQTELEKKEELLSVLQARKIEIVIMQGLEVNPAGYGKIIWDPEKRSAILQISNLPPVDKEKDYQLWVIKDNKPISAGVFGIDKPDKEKLFKIENLAETDKQKINAFAVTLEPKGGVPQPTGKMYLLGNPVYQ